MLITERLQRPLKVLGMPRNLGELVSFKDIQGQYRKLAFMTQPDKNSYPDAAEIFKVVGAAYESLKDAFEKKQSDTTQMESTDPTFNTYMAETQAYLKNIGRKCDKQLLNIVQEQTLISNARMRN